MYDIVVIFAGPAGLTAALYARRASKTVMVLEKGAFGGQITFSPKVENIPGFASLTGNEFAEKLVDQALGQGAEVDLCEVTEIKDNGDTKIVVTDSGEYEAKAVIIATGATHRLPGLDREFDFIGNGISFCAVCDGAFFKGLTVAVVGGGSSALQDAIMLSDGCEKVYLIYRSTLRGEKQLIDTLRKREKGKLRHFRKNAAFAFGKVFILGYQISSAYAENNKAESSYKKSKNHIALLFRLFHSPQ